jgi:hypothetical protein
MDEIRFWISRWEPYGLGTYLGYDPTNAITTTGAPLPPCVVGRIGTVLRLVCEGPLSSESGDHHA